MSRGWENEPFRHSLSSKGIETVSSGKIDRFHKKEKYPPIPDYQKVIDNPEKMSIDELREFGRKFAFKFWWHSVNNDWKGYDFDKSVKSMKSLVRGYINWEAKLLDEKGQLTEDYYRTDWGWQVEDMIGLYRRLEEYDKFMKRQKKISIIDESIHTEHLHGNVFNLDIDKLRQDFKEEYL